MGGLDMKDNMNELLKILLMLKEDFEILQNGSHTLNYLEDELQASIDNVEKAIKIVKNAGG